MGKVIEQGFKVEGGLELVFKNSNSIWIGMQAAKRYPCKEDQCKQRSGSKT